MQELIIDKKQVILHQIDEICYITPWTKFILSKIPQSLDKYDVCDYGAGTGILSIVASIRNAKSILSIEKDNDFINLMKKNFSYNNLINKIDVVKNNEINTVPTSLDYIFCNPACYPSSIGENSLYCAGEMGLDMIIEVIHFAQITLKKSGQLFVLIPSILPVSLVQRQINDSKMFMTIHDSIDVELRKNLSDKIMHWVDKHSSKYKEMRYYLLNGKIFERVYFYTITF